MSARAVPGGGSMKRAPAVVIAGIGTGGHYFPAVVTAVELRRRGCEVICLAREGSAEEHCAHERGLRTFPVKARPFFGKSPFQKSRALLATAHSIMRLRKVTRRSIGLAFGGFGSVPLVVSCLLNRRDFYVFEPNRVPGRATRLFAPVARKVFLGMPPVRPLRGRTLITGVPIRQEFKGGRGKGRSSAARPSANILFYGGSQGARRLNDLAVEIAHSMAKNWRLTVIAGERDYERLLARRSANMTVIPFSAAPWNEIGQADVIVSRSGALAGYEILASGKKAIFVPFPFAIDRHQHHNALYFAAIGDAAVHEEKDATAATLRRAIESMLTKKEHKPCRLIMDAEQRIAAAVLKGCDR